MYGRGLNSCLDGISSCGLWIVDGEKVVWCVGDDVKEREGQGEGGKARILVKEASEGGNRVKEKRESFLA
jgi:hypothetical protein